MADDPIPSKLAVLLHADIVGSTKLVRADESIAHQRIRDVFQRFSETITAHGGITHEIRGDALVAEFGKASDAVGAAIAFQESNALHNNALDGEIIPEARIGVAMGEVVVADNTVTGEGVVLAQRLEQLAGPGEVRLQDAVYQTLPKRLPFHYQNLGECELKGFNYPVRVYGVTPGSPDSPLEEIETSESRTVESPYPDPSIAVLPFDNMSGDPDQEYFSDGITEDIITALSRISGLSVIARDSVMIYKNKATDIREVGREQGVQFVLKGGVRKADNRVRVTVQLVDSVTGHNRWADRYDRNLDDIFAVQDDITHNIAVEMHVHLSLGEKARMLAGRTNKVAAWEKQMLADELNNRFVRNDNWTARRLCEEALSLDPDYVSAWTEYGWTHMTDVLCGWTDSVEESLKQTGQAVERALDLEKDYPLALALLGYVYTMQENYGQAIEVSEKAVTLAPDNAEGVAELAHILLFAGRTDEALPVINKALNLCPMRIMWQLSILGQCQTMAGVPELAIDTLREAVFKGAESPFPRICLVAALMEAGEHQEAKRIAREVLQLEGNFSLSRWRGHFFQDTKERKRITRQLAEAGLPL